MVRVIALCTGENDYELTKKVAQFSFEFKGNSERYDAQELSREQIADIFAGQSLFAEQRLVIIDTPSLNSDLWSHLQTWADRLSSETRVILVEPKLDKRTAVYKWLKKNVEVLEFPLYDERDTRGLLQWANGYAQQLDIALTSQQMSRLVARAGNNQWEIAHALDKLSLAGQVTDEWIDAVTQDNPHENVFALFDTVLRGDVGGIATAIQTLRLHEDAYRMFGLLNTQVLQLAVLVYADGDSSRAAADSGAASAYPYQKLSAHAVRLTKSQAKQVVELFAGADSKIKSSDADPWIVLESTLVQVASLLE